jgi:hypothetical protein
MTDEPRFLTSMALVRDACTLPTAQLPLRRAEFDDLFATTVDVERRDPQHARLRLAGAEDLVADARDLTARETECCSFFTFTVTPEPPDRVVLHVAVPEAYTSVLDALVDRAERARIGRAGIER